MIQAQNISLYGGTRLLCADLNLHIKAGEYWGVLGQNGSGKTTLLHTLAGLLAPRAGRILLNDKPLAAQHPKHIAQLIGILFQDSSPGFPLRVLDYCSMARYPHLSAFQVESTTDKRITQDALHAMDLEILQQRTLTSLSGGERRRLELAALLTQTPSVYLLDEPTNHLDLRYQMHVLQHFQQLATQQHAVVTSLHDVNLAERYCNRILLLFPDGSNLQGTPDEVLNETNLYKLYECPISRQHLMWAAML